MVKLKVQPDLDKVLNTGNIANNSITISHLYSKDFTSGYYYEAWHNGSDVRLQTSNGGFKIGTPANPQQFFITSAGDVGLRYPSDSQVLYYKWAVKHGGTWDNSLFDGWYTSWTDINGNSINRILFSTSKYQRAFIIGEQTNMNKQFVTLPDVTHPSWFITSETDWDTDKTQWGRFFHDTTNFNISTGKGDIKLSPASDVDLNAGVKIKSGSTIQKAMSGDLLLACSPSTAGTSAATLNAAAAGTFTKDITINLQDNLGTIHKWSSNSLNITTSVTSSDTDIVAPTVSNATPNLVDGTVTVTLTYDTDAGATKTYSSGDIVSMTISSNNILGYPITSVTFTDTLVA